MENRTKRCNPCDQDDAKRVDPVATSGPSPVARLAGGSEPRRVPLHKIFAERESA